MSALNGNAHTVHSEGGKQKTPPGLGRRGVGRSGRALQHAADTGRRERRAGSGKVEAAVAVRGDHGPKVPGVVRGCQPGYVPPVPASAPRPAARAPGSGRRRPGRGCLPSLPSIRWRAGAHAPLVRAIPPLSAPASWGLTAALSYASTIESNSSPPAIYLLDSEILRVRLGVSHDLSPRTFVLADAELLGAYSGFLDGFLDWYHGLLGISIPERERRPHDEFGYFVDLPGEAPLRGHPDDAFLGDMRLGVGVRVHPAVQSVAVVTLPTSTGPEGYGHGVVTAGLLNTAHLPLSSRLIGEGSLGLGFAPSHGTLAESQHELMASGSVGARFRLFGRQSLYGNLFYHTPYYHDTANAGARSIRPGARLRRAHRLRARGTSGGSA